MTSDPTDDPIYVALAARREAERLAEKPSQPAKFAAPAPRAAPCNYGDGA